MSVKGGQKIITDGLVLALDAGSNRSNKKSGTTWYDLSGVGNHGTLTAEAISTISASLNTMAFNGLGENVLNSSTTNMPISSSNRTLSIWIYPTSDDSKLVQIGTGGANGSGVQAYIFTMVDYGGPSYLYTDGHNATNNISVGDANQIPSQNEWHYLVFGNSGQDWFYYLNAVERSVGTWTVPLDTIGQQYAIGDRVDIAGDTTFQGYIGQVTIHDKALSATEILENYNNTKGRYL